MKSSVSLTNTRLKFWSVKLDSQVEDRHGDCPRLLLPVACIGPSDLWPLLCERVALYRSSRALKDIDVMIVNNKPKDVIGGSFQENGCFKCYEWLLMMKLNPAISFFGREDRNVC